MTHQSPVLDQLQAEISDDACKQLWAAVLHQSIDDAKAPEPVWAERDWDDAAARSTSRRPMTAASARTVAYRAYLNAHAKWRADRDYIGGRSFREVCWLCGLDPEAVEWRVRQQMEPGK